MSLAFFIGLPHVFYPERILDYFMKCPLCCTVFELPWTAFSIAGSSGTLKASNGDYNVTIVIGSQPSSSSSSLSRPSHAVYYYSFLAMVVAWALLHGAAL